MNAQIVKDENNKFYLYNSTNRKYLTDFLLEKRLLYFNTKFLKKEGKL